MASWGGSVVVRARKLLKPSGTTGSLPRKRLQLLVSAGSRGSSGSGSDSSASTSTSAVSVTLSFTFTLSLFSVLSSWTLCLGIPVASVGSTVTFGAVTVFLLALSVALLTAVALLPLVLLAGPSVTLALAPAVASFRACLVVSLIPGVSKLGTVSSPNLGAGCGSVAACLDGTTGGVFGLVLKLLSIADGHGQEQAGQRAL